MIFLLAPLPFWSVDLSQTDGGFVSGGQTGQWEWAVPSVGPVGAGACWCTSCDGPYLHDTVDWLEIVLPNLGGVGEPSLLIRHWYEIRDGDGGVVEVDDGGGFVRVDPAYGYPDPAGFVGQTTSFGDAVFDLAPFGPNPVVRLTFGADAAQSDAGWFVSAVELWDGDIVAPSVAVVSPPVDTQDLVGPYVVEAEVVDDRAVTGATLWYAVDGSTATAVTMSGTPLQGGIPGLPAGSEVTFRVEATDGINVGRWPVVGDSGFRVFLAAPTKLAAADGGRTITQQVDLTWEPPVSPHPVVRYRVMREGSALPVAVPTSPAATVPLEPDQPQTFWVEAEYDVGVGDPSEAVELAVEVPELDAVDPPVGYQGDELFLRLYGRSLYLLQGESTLDLGPDIDVLELDVRDVGVATAHVVIGREAPTGPVDLTIGGPAGTFVFESRFDVRDGADAPRITRVSPAVIGQGEEKEITLESTVSFANAPVIGTDEDLLVTGEVEWEGAIVRVPLVAGTRARPGVHTLSVDDGERLYTVELEVEERSSQVKGCSTTTGEASGGWWALLAGLPLLRRRSWPQVEHRAKA